MNDLWLKIIGTLVICLGAIILTALLIFGGVEAVYGNHLFGLGLR